jgi:hypothetical protein
MDLTSMQFRIYIRQCLVLIIFHNALSAPSASASFLLDSCSGPKIGGDTFLRHDGFSPNYRPLKPRRANCTCNNAALNRKYTIRNISLVRALERTGWYWGKARVRKVFDSNFGLETVWLRIFVEASTDRLDQNRFLPNPFQFIIHQSPYHPNLLTDVIKNPQRTAYVWIYSIFLKTQQKENYLAI